MYKPAIIMGITLAALAVVIGAFGAHSLRDLVAAKELDIYEKGVAYQFYHSFGLIAAGVLHSGFPQKSIRLAAPLFGIGILLFCGSLYLMVALSISSGTIGKAGIITPLGGLCFIAGWLSLLIGIIMNKK